MMELIETYNTGYNTVYSRSTSTNRKMQDVSKGALEWYSTYYCMGSITKTFTLKAVQSIHRSKY
jgi:hypothetical protein